MQRDVNIPRLFERSIVRPKFQTRAEALRPAPRPLPAGRPLPFRLDPATLLFLGLPTALNAPVSPALACFDPADPAYRRLHRRLLRAPCLQIDALPVRVSTARRRTTARRWVRMISLPGEPLLFDRIATPGTDTATAVLDGFGGFLQVRDLALGAAFARRNPGLAVVGCWADARSRFLAAHREAPKAVEVVLRIIDWFLLCDELAEGTQASAAARLAQRRALRRPLFWLKRLATGLREQRPCNSKLHAACDHLLTAWEPLTRHFTTGKTRLAFGAPCAPVEERS
jgi:hypothetical protein